MCAGSVHGRSEPGKIGKQIAAGNSFHGFFGITEGAERVKESGKLCGRGKPARSDCDPVKVRTETDDVFSAHLNDMIDVTDDCCEVGTAVFIQEERIEIHTDIALFADEESDLFIAQIPGVAT